MLGLEAVMEEERPDAVLVYGTQFNPCRSAHCRKMQIPIAHVEAGPRSHSLRNAEESNRVCVDHLSSILLAATESGFRNLKKEGLEDRTFLVGDPIRCVSALRRNRGLEALRPELVSISGGSIDVPSRYCYLTCHRAENMEKGAMSEILIAASTLSCPVIYPVHPRAL